MGNLFLSIHPAATIMIDSGMTFFVSRDTICEMSASSHFLEIIHPDYPVHKHSFDIISGKVTTYRILLDTLFAYFHCTVYTWGDIYIDQKYIVQTTFFNPLRLNPGSHLIQIKNPGFSEFADSLSFFRGDTINLKIDLEKLSKSQRFIFLNFA